MSFASTEQKDLRVSHSYSSSAATYVDGEWVRNPTWLPLPSIAANEQKFVGIYQVNRYSSFIAFNFTTSTGQYTVDWGDGSAPVNVNSGANAQYLYDYTDVDLDGTDGPVTFTASTGRVNRNNHGYSDGMNISFASIVTTTGIAQYATYYVINSTANDFQLSLTVGGSPISLTNDGSGTILPYKQVVVTVTPVSGNLTGINLNVKHSQAGLGSYSTGWMDIALAGSYTSLTIGGGATNVAQAELQQVRILSSNTTSFSGLFNACIGLRNVVEVNSSAIVTNMTNMFTSCQQLTKAPILNTSRVTDMSNMFSNCWNLVEIPSYDTANVANTVGMFTVCYSLVSAPLLNTSNVTNTAAMFNSCSALKNVPLYNTSKVTNMVSMFGACTSLQTIPLLDTANVGNMVGMFTSCFSLETIPPLNTIKVFNTSGMFDNCRGLISVPSLNLANVTFGAGGSINNMFVNCYSLTTVGSFGSVPLVQNINGMFTNCFRLKELPPMSFPSGSGNSNAMPSLRRVQIYGGITTISWASAMLSGPALNEIYTNLTRVGSGGGANANVTFQVIPDTVTKLSHGYVDGEALRFTAIANTTNITNGAVYFVRNATTDTFQISAAPTSAIINLTGTDGTATIQAATITVTGNYGTATDDPTIATNKGWTVTGS